MKIGRLQAYVLKKWNDELNGWVPLKKYIYYWSIHNITTGVPEVLSHERFIEIYPNPGNDYICVKTTPDSINATISIYNSSSQKGKTLKSVSDVTYTNVNDLPAGNYILQSGTD